VSDVTDTIDDLHAGRIGLDEAAGRFRGRQWPARPKPADPLLADAAGDLEPEPEGGFGEVQDAYNADQIDGTQYQALAQAAAEAMAAQALTAAGTPQELLDAHSTAMNTAGSPPWATPSPQAVATVWERGKAAWPGPAKTARTPGQWAAGRTRAFLARAGGNGPAGYQRDDDLLPEGHPARTAS
jgi:hypothetical protein